MPQRYFDYGVAIYNRRAFIRLASDLLDKEEYVRLEQMLKHDADVGGQIEVHFE